MGIFCLDIFTEFSRIRNIYIILLIKYIDPGSSAIIASPIRVKSFGLSLSQRVRYLNPSDFFQRSDANRESMRK